MALRASEWKKIINSTQDLNSAWIDSKRQEIGLDPNSTWYYDQWITTHGLLKNRLCTAPPWSGLWNAPGLEFDPGFDDRDQCWHGQHYKDCNIDMHIVPHGCKWFHFYPFQTFEEHVKKFNELTKNEYNTVVENIYEKNYLVVLEAAAALVELGGLTIFPFVPMTIPTRLHSLTTAQWEMLTIFGS